MLPLAHHPLRDKNGQGMEFLELMFWPSRMFLGSPEFLVDFQEVIRFARNNGSLVDFGMVVGLTRNNGLMDDFRVIVGFTRSNCPLGTMEG